MIVIAKPSCLSAFSTHQIDATKVKGVLESIITKECSMQPLVLLLLAIVVVVCVFGYNAYRASAKKRAWEKRRNIFRDRV